MSEWYEDIQDNFDIMCNKEQRSSGSEDKVWMTNIVIQMKSVSVEEWNELEIEHM